jgi:hypothetical protein
MQNHSDQHVEQVNPTVGARAGLHRGVILIGIKMHTIEGRIDRCSGGTGTAVIHATGVLCDVASDMPGGVHDNTSVMCNKRVPVSRDRARIDKPIKRRQPIGASSLTSHFDQRMGGQNPWRGGFGQRAQVVVSVSTSWVSDRA